MSLLFIGIAVGLAAAFMLRTLMQYERQGLSQVVEGLARLEETVETLEERVVSLEAIAASDERLPLGTTSPTHDPSARGSERQATA